MLSSTRTPKSFGELVRDWVGGRGEILGVGEFVAEIVKSRPAVTHAPCVPPVIGDNVGDRHGRSRRTAESRPSLSRMMPLSSRVASYPCPFFGRFQTSATGVASDAATSERVTSR